MSDRADTAGPGSLPLSLPHYAAFGVWAATWVCVFQLIRLSRGDALPHLYFGKAAFAHLALLIAGGLISFVPLLAVCRFWSRLRHRSPVQLAAFGATLGIFVPYMLLNISYGGANDPFHARATVMLRDAAPWLGGLAVLMMFAGLLSWRVRPAGVWIRAAVMTGLGWLLIGGLYLADARAFRSVSELDLDPTAERRPHVFVVLVDTLRADHLPIYGYEKDTAPVLTEFASKATVYDRAIAPASWTRPSCAALFTSRYPSELGGISMTERLHSSFATLPQLLEAEGYATASIVANHNVSPLFGFDRGFDHIYDGISFISATGIARAFERLRIMTTERLFFPAERVTDQAIDWLKGRESDEAPVFLYLHYIEPHEPYADEPEAWRDFATGEAAKLDEAPPTPPWYRSDPTRRSRFFKDREPTPILRQGLLAAYDADIRTFDKAFERFLSYVEQEGFLEDSLFIFISDHGEEFGDHGHWQHGHTLYKEVLHVPFVIRWPDHLAPNFGPRSDRLVSLVDVLPTVRDVLGAQWGADFSGISLVTPQPPEVERWVYANGEEFRCLYLNPYKLIQYLDEEGEVQREERFDFEDDFQEKHPVTTLDAETTGTLEAMRVILADVGPESGEDRESIELDPATLEQLEKLGYL